MKNISNVPENKRADFSILKIGYKLLYSISSGSNTVSSLWWRIEEKKYNIVITIAVKAKALKRR